MYLHYKYGDVDSGDGDRKNGDPAVALGRFHAELQRTALKELKEKSSPELWDTMMSKRFPQGIFGSDNSKLLLSESKE
jgi:hypothetical protein